MLTSSDFSSLLRILSKSIHCRLVVVQAKKAIPANLAKVLKDKLLCIILTTTASQILIPKRKKQIRDLRKETIYFHDYVLVEATCYI